MPACRIPLSCTSHANPAEPARLPANDPAITGVAVAQWRASRPKPPSAAAGPPAPPSAPVAARPPGRGLARTAAVAITLGTVTVVCSGLGDVVFGLQRQDSTSGQEALLSVLLGAAGLGKRQRRLVRLGLLAVALSRTFRPATWLTTFL